MRHKRGAAAQQYALIVGLIAVVAVAATGAIGAKTRQLFISTGNRLDNAVAQTVPPPAAPDTSGTRLFVIAGSTTGNMGGISGADAICAGDASRPADGRTYIALLSTSTTAAGSRTTITYPVRQANSPTTIVAADFATLMGGPINSGLSGWVRWTGTNPAGGISSLGTCNNWTASSPTQGAASGSDGAPMSNGLGYNCTDYSGKIYCISTTP